MDEHPLKTEIEAYCRGGVQQSTVDRIEQHLVDCSDCARIVHETVRQLVEAEHTRIEP